MGALELTSGDPGVVTQLLQRATSECHLISPATTCPSLPEGFEVATQLVLVDVPNETYEYRDGAGTGRRCLAKEALDRIAAAAGISWTAQRSDDRRHPFYCEFVAFGHYRQFDNSTVQISGSKTFDLRDGSPEAMQCKAGQLMEKRRRITALCETMARLRAVRSIGIRSAYAADELRKPFLVARVVFTGRTSDPELRRAFALMGAQAALSSSRAIYGPPMPWAAVPAMSPPMETPEPPPLAMPAPVHALPARDVQAPAPMASAPIASAPRDATPQAATAPARSGFTVPGGPEQGRPIEDASDGTLAYWVRRIGESLNTGNARNPERDRQLVAAMDQELTARSRRAGPEDDRW